MQTAGITRRQGREANRAPSRASDTGCEAPTRNPPGWRGSTSATRELRPPLSQPAPLPGTSCPVLCEPAAAAGGKPQPARFYARCFIYTLFLPDYSLLEIELPFLFPPVFTSPVY